MTVYFATHADKHVERDSWKHGCDPDSGRFTMMERIIVTASSVADLRKQLCERFALPEDEGGGWAFSPDTDDPARGRLVYSRHEDDEGSPASEAQREAWKRGERSLWLADYAFEVSAYEPVAIPESEVSMMESL